MIAIDHFVALLLAASCTNSDRALFEPACSRVHSCVAGDAQAPSVAPPQTSSDVGFSARLVSGRGVADGLRYPHEGVALVSLLRAFDDPQAHAEEEKQAEEQKKEDGQTPGALRSLLRRARESTQLSGWALARLIRSGRWGGTTSLTFEGDSSDNATGEGAFHVGRNTVAAQAAVRNPALVLGPRLLIGNAGLDLTVGRDAFTVGEEKSLGIGRVVGYDFGATVLPDRRYSAAVFVDRNHIVFPRLFGTARERQQSRRGVVLRLNGPFLESIIDWTRISSESLARNDRGARQDGEVRHLLSYSGTRRSESQSFLFEHRRERRIDLIFPDLSFPLEVTRLRHAANLDRDVKGRTLTTAFAFNRRAGTVQRDHLRGETRLDYQLNPSLDMRSAYRVERIHATAIRQLQQSVESRLRHRLYESLITTLTAGAALDELDTGQRKTYGAGALFEYRKKLLGGGRLSATVSRRYDYRDNRFEQAEDIVIGEGHDARLAAPFRLQQPRVQPGSIVVTDSGQSTIYREGFDYDVDFVGEFAEIRILPGGRIEDGQSVMVDYRIQVSPLTTIAANQSLAELSVDYGWIHPYVRLQRANRDLIRGVDDGTVFDQPTRTAGLMVRWSPGAFRFALRNEQRTENARNLAFDSLQFAQLVSYSFSTGRVVTLSLDEIFTDFRVPARRETRESGRLDFRWQLTPVLSVEAGGVARVRRDTVGFDENFYQAGIDAHWERDILDLVVSVSRDWGDRAGARFEGLRMSVRAARTF